MSSLKFAVLTVSSSCAEGTAVDRSGPVLEELVKSRGWTVSKAVVVPDVFDSIKTKLFELSQSAVADVVFTTGGTGLTSDDCTPEATKAVVEQEIPGITLAMFRSSIEETPFAMLSRSIAGILSKTIIINMPGSVRAVRTCFATVAPIIEHAVALVKGKSVEISKTHSSMVVHGHGHGHSHNHGHCHHRNVNNLISNRRLQGEERPRESAYPTIPVSEALAIILCACQASQTESIFLDQVNLSLKHRFVAANIVSLEDVPSFRASIKDGYAVRSEDETKQRLVVGRSDAGCGFEGDVLKPGFAVAINTGAKVPDSADAVVQIEDTKFISGMSGDILETVEILSLPKPGQDIRPAGCDLKVGEKLMSVGDPLHPASLALLISGGHKSVLAFKLPGVAVFSTGSELVQCGEAMIGEDSVRDSNRPMLLNLLRSNGFPCHDGQVALDNIENLVDKFNWAFGLSDVEVIITTGGVSMGDRDHVKDVLKDKFGATIHFGRVFMKPGKPTVFATLKKNGRKFLIFSLPGNPVSALVTANLFVLPALRRLSGSNSTNSLPTIHAKLGHDFYLDPRPEYHRVMLKSNALNGCLEAFSTGLNEQASSRIASASVVDCQSPMLGILALPAGTDSLKMAKTGSVYPVHPLVQF